MWGCTVREAQSRCTAREFAEWKAYRRLECFPDERIEHQLAQLASLLANIHRDRKKPPYKAAEFVIEYDRQPKSPQQLEAEMMMWARQHNAIQKRKRGEA